MEIRFDRLNDVVRATELLPLGGFNMGDVDCGYAGCMIGNYWAMVERRYKRPSFGSSETCDFFGIAKPEFRWLFGEHAYGKKKLWLKTDWEWKCHGLRNVTSKQALARLRKYLAYKKRKHDLIHDPKYGVSDRSRRAEGDQCFVMLAVADALVSVSVSQATAT